MRPNPTCPAGTDRIDDTQTLGLWVGDARLGTWARTSAGEDVLTYDPDWISSPGAFPLSLSLPLSAPGGMIRGAVVGRYFDNLLPDSPAIRQRLAVRWAGGRDDAFSLLAALGRDCAGALQILPAGRAPGRLPLQVSHALSELEVERILADAVGEGAAGCELHHHANRLALAGAQEKTGLIWAQGAWRVPLGGTPSTHILKLPMGLVGNSRLDLSRSVDNEWLCMQILAAYGLPVASTAMVKFGERRALLVERFDRSFEPNGCGVRRLMQEDFCQALGLPAGQKYEADGGPGLVDLLGVLGGSDRRVQDFRTIIAAQVLFWMLAATDGHAKNFSIRHLAGGRYRLAPLYDVLSMHPLIGPGANQVPMHKVKLAMAVRGKSKHYEVARIQRRHFNATAQRGAGMTAEPIIEQILAKTPRVIEQVAGTLPEGFDRSVADAILGGLAAAARRLESMPAYHQAGGQ